MNRLVLFAVVLASLATHSPRPLPMAQPIVVSQKPLSLFSVHEQSERRDSVVLREARRLGVPRIVAYAVTHAETYSGDSTAVSSAGAVGIMQIMPANFDSYPECYGARHITDMKRNACVGLRLLSDYRDEEGSWAGALKRYVGFKTNVMAWMAYADDIIDHMVDLED